MLNFRKTYALCFILFVMSITSGAFSFANEEISSEINKNMLQFIFSYYVEDHELLITEETSDSFFSYKEDIVVIGIGEGYSEGVANDYFMKYYKENVEKELPNIEVVKLLHEIGHIKTESMWTSEDFLELNIFKMKKFESVEDMRMSYRQLKIEKMADEWAFKILKNNFRVIDGEIKFIIN